MAYLVVVAESFLFCVFFSFSTKCYSFYGDDVETEVAVATVDDADGDNEKGV